MAVGKIDMFDLKDSWDSYCDRLEQFFIVNNIAEERRVATLITVMGGEAYELMVNLCTPSKPASYTYTALVKVMKDHLQSKRSILAERYKFRIRKQRSDESISDYVTELKRMSKTCNFGVALTENLRDQFVCGLNSDSIRQRLFAEEDLKFDKACRLASTMEAAEADAALVDSSQGRARGESVPTAPVTVHRATASQQGQPGAVGSKRRSSGIQGRGRRPAPWAMTSRGGASMRRQDEGPACRCCGGAHDTETCKFKMYVCRVCNSEGHLRRVCPRLKKTSSHYVDEVRQEDSDCSDEVMHYSISSSLNKYLPYKMTLSVNNINLEMELDTGSTISCISYTKYLKLFSNCTIMRANLLLRYYTGETVEPIGKIKVLVEYKNIKKKLDLYIIDRGTTSLLGREWLREMDIKVPTVDCAVIKVFNLNDFSSKYCDVFAPGLGRFTGGTVTLRVRADARPVFMRARPLAYALREPVERALEELVADGVITPVETADWATPIVPVVKKDGSIRICGDFKLTLNKILEVDRFPVPRVDDLLARLYGGERFSKIDLSQAYAQFVLDEDSTRYTVINTHKGLFRYNRLIYGLSSSPGIFQRKLEQLMAGIPFVGVFLDDVIITGKNDREHVTNLSKVFDRLQKYGLKIREGKCAFFKKSVTYLGYVIDKDGVHTCPEKVEAISRAPVPTNVTELRSFLGLVMYYAKFVPNISTVLEPLYQLLKIQVPFRWSEKCQTALDEIKRLLSSSTVLTHYSLDLPLVLTTDASSVGVGAVVSHLMPAPHGERPIAYASRVLNAAEKGYSQIEKEALAIVYGVRKFHQYLFGRKFILRTDHKPLISIFGSKAGIPVMAASRMQRWAVLLSGYDYDIEYVRSNCNGADALSRLPVAGSRSEALEVTYLNFVQNFLPVTKNDVKISTERDPVLRKVVLSSQAGWAEHCEDEDLKPYFTRRNELYIEDGCVMWGYRLVIPVNQRKTLLDELHMGHLGIVKMKAMARSYMWWPGIDGDIERRCQECTACVSEAAAPPRASPSLWPYVTEPWTRVHVDFLGPFHGHTFLVIVDSSTKWIEAFLMNRTTASAVVKVLRETFARFGIPREIVSDNGPPFSSREYAEFMMTNGIKTTFSPVYHPSSNGAAENAVKLCKRAVKKALHDKIDIEASLQTYLLAYRNVAQGTTGRSPAMLLQHRNLRSRLDLLRGSYEVEERVRATQQKQVANAGGVMRRFGVGDEVWTRVNDGRDRWSPGKIEGVIGTRNYLVGRENGPPVKRHVDQLKKKPVKLFDIPCPSSPSASNEKLESGRSKSDLRVEQAGREDEIVGMQVEDEGGAPPSAIPRPGERSQRIRRPVKRFGFEID